MIEQFDSRLQGFFDEMVDALIPERRTDDNKEAAKKSIVTFCYLLVGLRNNILWFGSCVCVSPITKIRHCALM